MTAAIKTNLGEANLTPEADDKDFNAIHGITRVDDWILFDRATRSDISNLFRRASGLHLKTGELYIGNVQTEERSVQDVIDGRSFHPEEPRKSSNIALNSVEATILFELERLFDAPLSKAELAQIFSDGAQKSCDEYLAEQREMLAGWLSSYHAAVARSKLQEPVLENDYTAKHRAVKLACKAEMWCRTRRLWSALAASGTSASIMAISLLKRSRGA